MKVKSPGPGNYVVAVSGGVDSIALLHWLVNHNRGQHQLVVAHFDHGIRVDSVEDRRLVQETTASYGLPFKVKAGKLGPASEAKARQARYAFLNQVREQAKSQAIITAHHQDDVIETAIINMLRGTARKGLSALNSRAGILRPLLRTNKSDIESYAQKHRLKWREDSSNKNEKYLRNYLRAKIIPRLSANERGQLIDHVQTAQKLNHEIDTLLVKELNSHLSLINLQRKWFNNLPHDLAREVLATWLRQAGIRNFERQTLERLVIAAKVGGAGKAYPIINGRNLEVRKTDLALK